MRKFYSLVLIAAGLLIGTNVWGFTAPLQPIQPKEVVLEQQVSHQVSARKGTPDGDFSFSVNGVGYNDLYEAFRACSEEHPVKLEKDITTSDYILLIKHPSYTAQDNYLDLNGYNYVYTETYAAFYFYNGAKVSLTITGKGTITAAKAEIAYMLGSTTDNGANLQVLNIGKDVTLSNGGGSYTYLISVYNNPAAYGVVINMNGSANCSNVFCSFSGNIQATSGNVPVLNIGATAKITCETAIYGAGYGEYNIYGELTCGDCGIYAKSGNYTIGGDAKIICTDTEYSEPTPYSDGFIGGDGCAIILDSKKGYAGEMHLTITDNAYIKSGAGYAITEVKTDADCSAVTGLVIESGTINGLDGLGSLHTTAELQSKVVVEGSITGGIYTDDITPYVQNENTVINYVDMGDGKYRWTLGLIPENKEWKSLDEAEDGDYVQMKSETETITELNGDKEVEYLALLGKNTVIVHNEEVLTAKEIVLNENAKIIVEPGGTVQVTSKQGIISTSDDNLEIHTQEGKPGVLLINPTVTFNTTPKGTVSFISKAYTTTDTYVVQRFGIPTGAALESITAKNPKGTADVPTSVDQYIYGSGWTLMGYFGCSNTPALDITALNKPFGYYQLQHGASEPGTVVTMTGALVGNQDATITLRRHSWCGFANSFMGNIDMKAILQAMFESDDFDDGMADVAVYSYKRTGDDTFTWYPVDLNDVDNGFEGEYAWKKNVEPMQAFILKNNGMSDITFSLNYKDLIYDPAVSPAQAPARSKNISNRTQVTIDVTNEAGLTDQIKLAESNEFSKGYDKGYDAQKYTNDDLNFYITEDNDKQMSHVASDDINNTFLGLSCLNGGTFTMTFSKLNSENFVLVDLENNNQIPMVEGGSYQFTVSNNESVDYRFQIKKTASVVTDMKEINANIKADNMIYTLAGQCVGHASNWSNLRSGVYILNGVKIVK